MGFESFEIDESDIDEYEEVQEAIAKYQESSDKLLEIIARRDKMKELLKIAQPSKVADVRKCIADCDDLIEKTEKIMEIELELIEQNRDLVRRSKRMEAFLDVAEPEFLKYIAENKPEKLEEVKAMLSDDKSSH